MGLVEIGVLVYIVIYGIVLGVSNYFVSIVNVIRGTGHNQHIVGKILDFIWVLVIIGFISYQFGIFDKVVV